MKDLPDARLFVVAAYREMPGLRLAVEQASRLFGLEHETAEVLLTALVADGVLHRHQQYFVARTPA
jgi:hypothetical protein